jgi:hypothetical protein
VCCTAMAPRPPTCPCAWRPSAPGSGGFDLPLLATPPETTDAQGRARLTPTMAVEPGGEDGLEWRLQALVPAARPQELPLVEGGAALELVLDPMGSIEARLEDSAGRPLGESDVVLRSLGRLDGTTPGGAAGLGSLAKGLEIEGVTDVLGRVRFETVGHDLAFELVRPDWVEPVIGPGFAGPSAARPEVRLVWLAAPIPPRVEMMLAEASGEPLVATRGLRVEARWPGGSFELDDWATGPEGLLRFELPAGARDRSPFDLVISASPGESVLSGPGAWTPPRTRGAGT